MSDLRTQRFCALPHRGIRSLVGRKDFAHRPGTSSISPDFLAIYIVDLQSEKSQICTISTFGLIFRRNRHRSCPHVDRSTQRSTHTSSLEATDLWGSRCNTRTLPKNVTTKIIPPSPGILSRIYNLSLRTLSPICRTISMALIFAFCNRYHRFGRMGG